MKIYKAQCKESGLFWWGGFSGYHSKLGKRWNKLDHLKSSLINVMRSELRYPACEKKEKVLEWRKNFFDKYTIIEYNVVVGNILEYADLYD